MILIYGASSRLNVGPHLSVYIGRRFVGTGWGFLVLNLLATFTIGLEAQSR